MNNFIQLKILKKSTVLELKSSDAKADNSIFVELCKINFFLVVVWSILDILNYGILNE